MKKFLKIFSALSVLCFIWACDENKTGEQASYLNEISNNHVYFFYQDSCPHCHHAASYIAQKYPNLKMINVDVRQTGGYNLFLKCANKFRLNQNTLGTPLICMGDHYIMGWADTDKAKFSSYVQKFK